MILLAIGSETCPLGCSVYEEFYDLVTGSGSKIDKGG